MKNLVELRHLLHSQPELSGRETETANTLIRFLNSCKPDNLISKVANTGILATYKGKQPGQTILLRCDMDALPINERLELSHKSINKGISHKCGHDGHMAIMCGVAEELSKTRPPRGTVVLLFQPEEETGQGAFNVISELPYKPDMCFALHNLPGFPLASIVTKEGPFAGASSGLIINLEGKSSHAAEPQEGISPAPAVASLISLFNELTKVPEGVMATLTHISIGKEAFGTSPGDATIMVTLRAPTARQMEKLTDEVSLNISEIASENSLRFTTEWREEFPATNNAVISNRIVEQTAIELGYKVITAEKAFPWSEDFGHFTAKYPGALFGLGAGLDHPALHNPDYDFEDRLIPVGISMFMGIIERLQAE